ncbi:MAG: hypothetical protein IJT77_03380 [Clostridia bacterium]|nr:hypothetical protein [Clostridia bacterium]
MKKKLMALFVVLVLAVSFTALAVCEGSNEAKTGVLSFLNLSEEDYEQNRLDVQNLFDEM